MLVFLNDFNFCSDIKRNWTMKEIEEDLNRLNNFYEILETRKEFFFTWVIRKI
jgi:hypothetical protein